MKTADQPHLVYIRGLKGPEPQKWAELHYGVGDWRRSHVLAAHPISRADFDHTSIEELVKRFPAPKIVEAA